MQLVTRIDSLPFDKVLILIQCGENDYEPCLSKLIDINACAEKWSKYAKFLTCYDGDKLASLLVFYENEKEKYLYITHFVVSRLYRNLGIGKKMQEALRNYAKEKKYNVIKLEVLKDQPAYQFYLKEGYQVIEDHGDRWLMEVMVGN